MQISRMNRQTVKSRSTVILTACPARRTLPFVSRGDYALPNDNTPFERTPESRPHSQKSRCSMKADASAKSHWARSTSVTKQRSRSLSHRRMVEEKKVREKEPDPEVGPCKPKPAVHSSESDAPPRAIAPKLEKGLSGLRDPGTSGPPK
ncbi:hypothetical protein MRX96_044991 [Rhipicephalus microplus]